MHANKQLLHGAYVYIDVKGCVADYEDYEIMRLTQYVRLL